MIMKFELNKYVLYFFCIIFLFISANSFAQSEKNPLNTIFDK